jgi:hydrogenase maturation protease
MVHDPSSNPTRRVLVAGMGSELQRDDAFGLEVVRRLASGRFELPETARVFEAGTAGIGLVQELLDRYDALIVVDAVDRDGEPGRLYVLEVDAGSGQLSDEETRELLADMHYTVPSRVLVLARALGVLPERVYLVGCQPADLELGLELSPIVAGMVDQAAETVVDMTRMLVEGKRDVSGYPAHRASG